MTNTKTDHIELASQSETDLKDKPIVDLTEEDLIALAEEEHWAVLLSDLYCDCFESDSYAAGLANIQSHLQLVEEIVGKDKLQKAYEEVERRHGGDPTCGYILQQLQRIRPHSAFIRSLCSPSVT